MTVYAELLKLAMAEDDLSATTQDELVAEAAARRAAVDRPSDAATRLAATLSYDTALAELCRRLGVEHDLTGEAAGPVARKAAEKALAAFVPALESTRP